MCKGEGRDLGMHRDITRRDFVNGVGFAVTGSLLAPDWLSVFERTGYGPKVQEYYPPALTGMRGSHPGSFEVAHALRDATSWSDASATGEHTRLLALGAVREALRIDVRSATRSARAQDRVLECTVFLADMAEWGAMHGGLSGVLPGAQAGPCGRRSERLLGRRPCRDRMHCRGLSRWA